VPPWLPCRSHSVVASWVLPPDVVLIGVSALMLAL